LEEEVRQLKFKLEGYKSEILILQRQLRDLERELFKYRG